MEVRWRWGAASDDGENQGGWCCVGSTQFSQPAPETSLESPQAMMLGERAGVRKGICQVGRGVWQDARAGQLCFPREAPLSPFSSAHGWRGDAGSTSCISDWSVLKIQDRLTTAWKTGPEPVASGVLCSY